MKTNVTMILEKDRNLFGVVIKQITNPSPLLLISQFSKNMKLE